MPTDVNPRAITIPAVIIPLGGDRYEVRPGKPIIDQELINTRRASAILGLSMDRICEMCEQGLLEAIKPGGRRSAQWRISLRSVAKRIDASA
jgi:hypothetical protein